MFDESLMLARQISDKSYEAENHQMLGLMCTGVFGTANYVKGKEHGVNSLVISEEAHLHWHTVPSLYTMALISMGSGEYQRAYEYVVRAKVQAEELGAVRLVAIGLGFEALLYEELNLLERAEATHREGIEVSLENRTDYFLVPLRAGLAIDRLRQGDLQVGEQLKRALVDANARDQMMFATRCLQGLVELSLAKDDPYTAMDYSKQLFNIAEAGGLREVLARVYSWRGQAQMAAGTLESAERNLLAALDLAHEIGSPRLLWDVHTALPDLYAALGNEDLRIKHEAMVKEIVSRISEDLTDPELRLGLPTN
jgi:ATP/maltotriose-dependent transcriptional regulator MalT